MKVQQALEKLKSRRIYDIDVQYVDVGSRTECDRNGNNLEADDLSLWICCNAVMHTGAER